MHTTANIRNFEGSLKEASPAVACCLATRAALRVAPLLVESLHLNGEDRRAEFVLPSFRLLATVSLASTWPTQATPLLARASTVARELGNTVMDTATSLQFNAIECKDALSDLPLYVRRFEDDSKAFSIAENVVSAIVSAVQSTVDLVDATNGIASRDAAYEAVANTLRLGHYAVDRSNSYVEFQGTLDGDSSDDTALCPHTVEYWNAVELDFEYLQEVKSRMAAHNRAVSALFGEKLWHNDMPVWAGRTWAGAPGELAEIRRCKSSMAKVVTRPCHSPSRAVAPARGRAKRRQGRMWVGLLSDEMFIVRSAEAVSLVEGNTARTATVRSGRAPRRLRTHARMYDRGRDLGGLPVATAHSAAVAKVEAVAERRTNGGEESDQGIVVTKLANKARGAAWRSRWSEGLGATGERCRQSTGWTQSREMRWGQEPASGPPVSQEPARHGSSRGVPSQPERGAGCVSAHVRIWAGPVG